MTADLPSFVTIVSGLPRSGTSISTDRLRRVFAQQLEKVGWWLADQPQFDIVQIDYHNVIEDPETQANRIDEFLGGRLDRAAMVAAVEPSLYRQRRDP